MSSSSEEPTLILQPLTAVPGQTQIKVPNDGPQRIGRDPNCELQLAHPSVSRRHASLEYIGERWLLSDLGSRHGTMVNGNRIDKNEPMQVSHGDSIAIPPLVFRVDMGEGALAEVVSTTIDQNSAGDFETVSRQELGSLEARRLELLMEGAGLISESRNEQDLVDNVLEILAKGTGLNRAAALRPAGDGENVELLGIRGAGAQSDRPFSRTLVTAAAGGAVVRLNEDPLIQEAVSIIGSGVQQAICVPVMVGDVIEVVLYIDSVEGGGGESDAAAFTAAVARLHGLTLANLKRLDLEEKQRSMLMEMQGARTAQERIMPSPSGTMGRVEYVVHSQPGRVVAGDLYGMVESKDGLLAIFLGDVSGKGAAAGMLMASIQATILAYVEEGAESQSIIRKLNNYVSRHSGTAEFATMFFLQFNPEDATAVTVDAGHGYALLMRGTETTVIESDGGPPVGAVPDMDFAHSTLELQQGDRLVIYSDGVAEQRDAADTDDFGVPRVIDVLDINESPARNVERIMEALREFAGGNRFADDVTVACIQIN